MKGKVALVTGLVAGYILGARAGRERYEQIKAGFDALMSTEPAIRIKASVTGFVGEKVSEGKDFVAAKTRKALFFMTQPEEDR